MNNSKNNSTNNSTNNLTKYHSTNILTNISTKTIKKATIFILLFFIAFYSISYNNNSYANNSYANNNSAEVTTNNNSSDTSLNIYSDAVILIDNDTGSVLYSKNSNEKMYPASTTKIMTAILTLEKGNLNDITTASYAATSVIPAGYSSAYLSVGEEITVEQLLEVLLIHSANDAANVLAEYVSGSIDEFVNLMNEKALEIGCKNTHFVNTNGIHDENHYTTAADLAIIAKYCLQNETFRKIISMPSCTIPQTNKSDVRKYNNTNALISSDTKYYYEGCIGGKTGYTSQAQNCLVSTCTRNGLNLIAVVLGASQTEDGSSARYVDTISLYNYGYSTYSISTVASKSDVIDTITVPKANSETKNLDLLLANDISALINTSAENDIHFDVTLKDDLSAPISANSVVGTVTYHINGLTYTEDLVAAHDVEKSEILINILRVILAIILLFIAFVILCRISRTARKR